MKIFANTGLSESRRAVMMRAAVMLLLVATLGSFTHNAVAQQSQEKRDDLDVTMQIIVDPDAKLPDEVVRRIPLPARKSAETPSAAGDKSNTGAGKERDNAANEHGKETSQAARERAREAAEQREAARRAEAEERKKRERGPPDDRPDPPSRPPNN